MKNFQRNALAGVIQLILFGAPVIAQAADSEALERRIRELEARLEKLEPAAAKPAAADPVVEKLTRKVNTLERKLEVQNEVTDSSFKKLPKFEAGANGFKIASQDDKNFVQIRGAVQTDARFFLDDSTDSVGTTNVPDIGLPDRFELKQARIWLQGKFWDKLYFKIMPDFAASNILPDAYLDYAYSNYASLSVGKQKTPLSLERLQGDSDGMFLERAFPTYLASNRDVGVMLHGEIAKPGYKAEYGGPVDFKNFLSYQVGVFNGTGDEGSPDKNAPDTNDDKEVIGRVFAHPFQHSGNEWLEGLGIGLAASWENPKRQALQAQRTPIGRATILDYTQTNANFSAAQTDGKHYRLYPQAYWYAGPFGIMGEYVLSSQDVFSNQKYGAGLKGIRRIDVKQDNTAWQGYISYVLTGEDNTFAGVKPIQPFNPFENKWGAFQVAARWSELTIDKDTFKILDPNKSVSHATSFALGLNWYLTSNALIRADYEQTYFEGGAPGAAKGANRPDEKVFGTRFQLAF